VGADNEKKHEIGAALMARSRIVTDSTEQCAKIADLHHAIDAGLVSRNNSGAYWTSTAGTPGPTIPASSLGSQLVSRIQPCDWRLPILEGSGVP